MIENYFVKLPNNTVWVYEDEEIMLSQDYDKLLVTMIYLDTHVTNIGICCFTLGDLIIKSGYVVTKGKGRSIEQFKNTLIYLQSLGWLDSTLNVKELTPKQFVSCKYKVKFAIDENENDTKFFKLYYEKFRKIMDSDSKLEKLLTVKIYCYMLARMKRNSEEQQQSIDTQYLDGTVVEEFHATYTDICEDLDIADNTLSANLNLLYSLDLIYSGNIGLVKNKDGSHMANNVYCETEEYFKRALTCSREYYTSKGYELIGKKCSVATQKTKGYKGKINEMKNQGKDTKELENKLDELQESITPKVKVVKPRKGIGKQLEYRNSISCQEENYNEICNKIENEEEKECWEIEPNTFDSPFDDDCYKIDVPKETYIENEVHHKYKPPKRKAEFTYEEDEAWCNYINNV